MNTAGAANYLAQVLDSFGAAWGLLHDDATSYKIGRPRRDIDIFCEMDGPTLLIAMWDGLASKDIAPVMSSNYDIGRGDAFWALSMNDGSIVQIDVLCDPRGLGRLGVPTAELIGKTVRLTGTLPTVLPEWTVCYQISKRARKRQWSSLSDIDSDRCDPRLLSAAMVEVFGRRAAARASALLREGSTPADWRRIRFILSAGVLSQRIRRARWGPMELIALRLARIWRRIRRPVGIWVHFEGSSAFRNATLFTDEIASLLPHWAVFGADRPMPMSLRLRMLRLVLRPGVAVSWSSSRDRIRLPRPTAVIVADRSSPWSRIRVEAVEAMSRHTRRVME